MKHIIKKFRIDKRIRVGYGSAFLLLLLSYILTLSLNRNLLNQVHDIQHTNSVINQLDDFLSLTNEAELGFRGYVITGESEMLVPYRDSNAKARKIYYALLNEIMQSPGQKEKLKNAKVMIDENYLIMGKAIEEWKKQSGVTNTLLSYEQEGKRNMDSLKKIIGDMQDTEEGILSKTTNKLQERYDWLNTVVIVSSIFALVLFVFGYITYTRENNARRIADVRAEAYKLELEERIKELNKANKELVEMRRYEKFTSTGRIARTIAHEVRNPLTNINLSVEQLKAEQESDGESRELFYDMILRNSQRINALITELLNSTRFVELNTDKISVNDLLDETLLLAKDRLQLKDITVKKNFGTNICSIAIDKEKIKIAFLNILVNAIEAMEPGKGVLTVATNEMNGKCVVAITDNGSGMDEETLNKLFEPYYSKKIKGTGLGLTNAENIILSHKGSIYVESVPGKGTTFTIMLDFTPKNDPPAV